MKIQTMRMQARREASLLAISRMYEKLARNSDRLEIIWFVTDESGKIVPTGNWNKMKFRQNQRGFREYLMPDPKKNVHAIDLLSGIRFTVDLSSALHMSSSTLRQRAIEFITCAR